MHEFELTENNIESVVDALGRNGFVIIRRAIEMQKLVGLSAAARDFAQQIVDRVGQGESFEQLEKQVALSPKRLALDLLAIDPNTCQRYPDRVFLDDSSVFQALKDTLLERLISRLLGERISWITARMRIVRPRAYDDLDGFSQLHQAAASYQIPGLLVFLMALDPTPRKMGVRRPGLELYSGDRAGLVNRGPKNNITAADLHKWSSHAEVATGTEEEPPDLASAGSESDLAGVIEGFERFPTIAKDLVRPDLSLGDMVIFDSCVPHGTFYPSDVEDFRVSCDIRLVSNPTQADSFQAPVSKRVYALHPVTRYADIRQRPS